MVGARFTTEFPLAFRREPLAGRIADRLGHLAAVLDRQRGARRPEPWPRRPRLFGAARCGFGRLHPDRDDGASSRRDVLHRARAQPGAADRSSLLRTSVFQVIGTLALQTAVLAALVMHEPGRVKGRGPDLAGHGAGDSCLCVRDGDSPGTAALRRVQRPSRPAYRPLRGGGRRGCAAGLRRPRAHHGHLGRGQFRWRLSGPRNRRAWAACRSRRTVLLRRVHK